MLYILWILDFGQQFAHGPFQIYSACLSPKNKNSLKLSEFIVDPPQANALDS